MNFSMRRVNAIFQKDFKDVSRNSAVSVSALMPLAMALVFGRIGKEASIDMHYMVINMTMVIVATFVQCSLIAEEKEKSTLRGLMLSPASTMEILGGKSLLSFVSTIVVIVIGAYLTGYEPKNLFIIAISIILSTFFFIGLGTILGLFSKSVMEASVIAMPFMMIFGFSTVFTQFAEKYPILNVIDYMPNAQLIEIARKVESSAGLSELWLNFGIIILWIIAVYTLAAFVFKKRKMD